MSLLFGDLFFVSKGTSSGNSFHTNIRFAFDFETHILYFEFCANREFVFICGLKLTYGSNPGDRTGFPLALGDCPVT
jgi:hypothetical protein